MLSLKFFVVCLFSLNAQASWKLGEPRVWVSRGVRIDSIVPQASNNNVSIERFAGKLFLAWRSSKDHFASKDTVTYVVHSGDEGKTWKKDLGFSIGADVREALLKSFAGKLHLFYFEAGSEATSFDPKRVVHRVRLGEGVWSEPAAITGPGEVVWDIKEHAGNLYKLSYQGPHYSFSPPTLLVKFEQSLDGFAWTPVDGAKDSVVYRGGVSEVAIEFDEEGNLYGVGRNEDGDTTGFGTQLFTAKASQLSKWTHLKQSLPVRYDSPRMFRHQGRVYLLSRHASRPFDRGMDFLPFNVRRWLYLGLYSLNTIRTALFELNTKTLALERITDLPSAGDNSFPSVVAMEANRFLVANYSSPLVHADWSWIRGQKSDEGTQIYGIDLRWVMEPK